MKKSTKKKTPKLNCYFYFLIGILCLAVLGVGIKLKIDQDNHEITIKQTEPVQTYEISPEPVPAVLEDDRGELFTDYDIPTMEEVDGGQFEDIDGEGEYEDLGWAETYNTKSPEAFKNDTLNKCIIANNKYGAQCVSLARVFWWSYADRDVSTCGTGSAKGMMICSDDNAGEDFVVFDKEDADEIQAGDWLVFTGGQYGHVAMALGPVVNGYVAVLGENQGGHHCEAGGSATNIININIKNLIGFYRPKAYIKVKPVAPDTGKGN